MFGPARFARVLTPAILLATALVAQAPPNDDAAGALPLVDVLTVGTTTGATGAAGSAPCAAFSTATPDVWYVVQPVASGTVVVETCEPGTAAFDPMIAVYNLVGTPVACNDDWCGLSSRVSFTASGSLPYLVRVGSYSGATGDFALSVQYPGTTPANDACANAAPIAFATIPGTTHGAAVDPAEAAAMCAGSTRNVWYSFTNPYGCPMDMLATLCVEEGGGASFDAMLGVWQGTCGATSTIACVDDAAGCGFRPRAVFSVGAYQTVLISVGGYAGAEGNFVLVLVGDSGVAADHGFGCALTPGAPAPIFDATKPMIGFSVFMSVDNADPGGAVAICYSAVGAPPLALPSGCEAYLDLPTFGVFWTDVADAAGHVDLSFTVPDVPAFVCFELEFQALAWTADGTGLGLSNGVTTRVGYGFY